jgi:outer membrane protein OmpA-like peptidoglycan-associated protein
MDNNMKRIIIALVAVAMAFTASAQQRGYENYAGLTLGGGLNTMTFSPADGTQGLGFGFDAGLHYAHFFNEHFGLGFGLHYTLVRSYAHYNFSEVTTGLTHANNPGVTYNLSTNFDNWIESQTVGLIGIPVEALWRTALGEKCTFIGGLGVQFDLPIHGNYGGAAGEYRTTGTFPALGNYEVSDAPEHGFDTYNRVFGAKIDNLAFVVSVIADCGVRFDLKNNWGLYLGIYGSYGLNNMLAEQRDASLLVVNTEDPWQIDYNGTFGSNQINALHLLRAGVKIGIDLGWDSKSTIAKRRAAQEAAERAAAEAAAKAAAEKAAAEAAAKAAAEKAAAEKAAREKAEAERLAAQQAAAAQAAVDRAAAEQAAAKAAAEREAAERAAAQAAADRAASEAAAAKAAAERAAAEKAEAERRALAERTRAEAEKQIKAINATVYFETAGTNAKFDAVTDAAIHAICEAMKADENLTVTVYGHTDNTGSLEINMKYGQKRAEALKAYMVKLGAPAKNINCVSRGPNEPVADNATEEGRAKNRRATVELK